MIDVRKPVLPLDEQAEHENVIAQSEKNAGLIDYVAMMADVELPEEEEGEINE